MLVMKQGFALYASLYSIHLNLFSKLSPIADTMDSWTLHKVSFEFHH